MVTGWPSTRMSPEVGVSVPDKILTSVLLPAPLSPMSAVTSPARTSKLTSDSALTWPYTFVMSRASSATLMERLLIDRGLSQLGVPNVAVTRRQCLARASSSHVTDVKTCNQNDTCCL